MPAKLNASELFASLPLEWPEDALPHIAERVRRSNTTLVVLDDDPTGTQTVYDVPVYTTWDAATLAQAFKNELVFYLLTNSRSLHEEAAANLAQELGANLRRAADGRTFAVISRSDSTLRGHYPLETDALTGALGQTFDATLLVPAFFEGGRYTLDDVHYVQQGDTLVPASETPFAKDAAFGYQNSNLKNWVEEKTGGEVFANEVVSITLEDIRIHGPTRVRDMLTGLSGGKVCVVNAASYRDLEVFTLGLLQAEAEGKRFLYRTAASFVRVRAGLGARDLLTRDDFKLDARVGGLVMVGSYVPLSTQQLEHLLGHTEVVGLELNVTRLLDAATHAAEVDAAAKEADKRIKAAQTAVVYTSRDLVKTSGGKQSLAIGRRVSDGLIGVLKALEMRPGYLVAKGGITSSDLATKGLGVKKALIKGQLLPGVPVWKLGAEARFPGLAYVVFPGNVGTEASLTEIVTMLRLVPSS